MNSRSTSALLVAAICALAGCEMRPSPTPEEVVAAERAFAEDGYSKGFKISFLAHSADDAIVLAPGPVNAHESIGASPDEDLTEPRQHLIWWPLYAGVARSGDLGFTTGPYAIDEDRRGHYFTVWKKQADGVWKWVFDAGVGADPAAEAEKGSPAEYLPTSRFESNSPEAAFDEVRAIEAELAENAKTDFAGAYDVWLDDDSRLHSDGPPPSKTPEDRAEAFAARPTSASLTLLGGEASSAGDLAWTYGETTWIENNEEKAGYYARIWQKRANGWRLVFDEFIRSR